MPLEPGSRIGSYEVVAAIGKGGMGEVYRAHDIRLSRDVAFKVLPDAVAHDPQRLARFQREAHVLASLNHQNIAHVYGLEELNGTYVLVMELVEGPTLFDRIVEGPIPLNEALPIATQIAAALEAAHEQGTVHRDLKPSNVKVRNDGVVKVLDFGLAKALVPAGSSSGDAETVTVTSPAVTHEGVILGTAAYMSPEQARGRPLDTRTDIWAFGCVLFEMLSGHRPFLGPTIQDVLVAVLSAQPDWSALARVAPPNLVRLLRHCLEKDPRQRLRHIGDARLELESPDWSDVRTNVRGGSRLTGWRLIAAVGALTVLGVVFVLWLRGEFGSSDTIWRQRSLVTSSAEEFGSRISPDGQWISFVANPGGATKVLLQRIDGGEVRPVSLPAGTVLSQLWSPDGDELAYVLRQGKQTLLQIVTAFFGGVPSRSMALEPGPNPNNVRLLRWIDQTIYVQVGRELHRVDLTKGTSTNVSDAWRVAGLRAFDVSPDGRRVAFTAFQGGQEDLWVANLDGTSPKRLSSDRLLEFQPLWSSNGSAVIFQSNRGGQIDLWQVDVDSDRFTQLTSSETAEEPESTSSDGTLVSFRQVSEKSSLWTWNPATDTLAQLTDDALSDLAPASSADGAGVVFQRSRRSPLLGNPLADSTLYFGLIDRLRFRSEPGPVADGFAARLSPDASRLAYLQGGADQLNTLFVKHLQSGETVTVSTTVPQPSYFEPLTEWMDQNLAWSPAGTELYFVDRQDTFTVRQYRVGARAAEGPLARALTREVIHDVHASANGTLAYLVSSGGGETLHLVDGQTGKARLSVPLPGRATARGWLPGDEGLVLARAGRFSEDFTTEVEVLVVSLTGSLRPISVIDRAFLVTTRLDPARGVMYLVRLDGGVHNLYELTLATGRLRRITDNGLPGVRFSGIEPLARAGLVGVRQERRSDIWMLVATPAGSPDLSPTR